MVGILTSIINADYGTIGTALITAALSFIFGYVSKAKGWWETRTESQKRAIATDVLTALEDGHITIDDIKNIINSQDKQV